MIIREAKEADKPWVDKNHKKFFDGNEYPDFFNYSCPFTITDDSGNIILVGGVKMLAEAVIITDISKPVGTRYDALLQALGSSISIVKEMGHKQFYVFVNNDEQYIKHLQKFNFRLIDAKLLVLDLGD